MLHCLLYVVFVESCVRSGLVLVYSIPNGLQCCQHESLEPPTNHECSLLSYKLTKYLPACNTVSLCIGILLFQQGKIGKHTTIAPPGL
jgi:hypothetical protein